MFQKGTYTPMFIAALFTIVKMCAQSLQSFPTLCDPMDHGPPGSSVRGILQERTLEWVDMPSSGGSSCPGIESVSPALAGGFLTTRAT